MLIYARLASRQRHYILTTSLAYVLRTWWAHWSRSCLPDELLTLSFAQPDLKSLPMPSCIDPKKKKYLLLRAYFPGQHMWALVSRKWKGIWAANKINIMNKWPPPSTKFPRFPSNVSPPRSPKSEQSPRRGKCVEQFVRIKQRLFSAPPPCLPLFGPWRSHFVY